MAQDVSIMAAAQRRFEADRERREAEMRRRTQEVYERVPQVESIDRALRGTAAQVVLAALDRGTDPEQALEAVKQENLALQRQRTELLARAGYAYDYLDSKPRCIQCQDKGFSRDGAPCRCLMAYYAQEQNRRLSKLLDLGSQSFDTFSFHWYAQEIWPEYGRSPLENMKMVYEICDNYAHTFGARSGNLLFSGAPGLGKTFLSACIAREVSNRGFSVVYDTAGHIFQQFEQRKFGRESAYEEEPDREVNRYLHCDLLIMDDLGTEMYTALVQSAFYQIINDRLLSRQKTVLSTNLTLSGIGERYGAAVYSRIQGEYQTLRFFGEDIRVQRSKR